MASVAVVGAGPTGLCAAIMLAGRGVDCVVLDRRPAPYELPRAVHLDDEVFRILAGLGIDLASISRPAPGMRLLDPSLRVLAEFTRAPTSALNGYPQANMLDQPDLEQLLRARLASLGVPIRTGEVTTLGAPDGSGVRLGLADGTEVHADAVLGCDGANSTVRELIGARLDDLGFTQTWLVVDAHSRAPLGSYGGVHQVCDPDQAATFMPVTPGRYRWEFRSRPGDPADWIRPWLAGADPSELTILRQAEYTFRGAVADRWRAGRVFLLGDAAHLTPPFIGQGLGAGIRDAANLTWKLAMVLNGQAADRLLDTYEAERRPYARRVVRLAMLVGWLMTGGTARTAPVRRALLRSVARLPGVARRATATVWPPFRPGPLVADRRAGRLFPYGLDDQLGVGFAVLGAPPPTGADRAWFDALGTTFLPHAPGALLVRPDRVVMAAAPYPDLRTWRRQLEAAGITP